MTANTNIRFEDWENDQMKDPEFRAAVEELEPAYQVARLRIMRGLTQEQVAELVGTKQSSIARLESGNTQPRLSFLRRVVEALGGRLEVRIMPQEEAAAPARLPIPTTTDVKLQNEGESEWHQVAMVPAGMVLVPPETEQARSKPQ
jgi:transcriptional regulator with XRE-family HTH domain